MVRWSLYIHEKSRSCQGFDTGSSGAGGRLGSWSDFFGGRLKGGRDCLLTLFDLVLNLKVYSLVAVHHDLLTDSELFWWDLWRNWLKGNWYIFADNDEDWKHWNGFSTITIDYFLLCMILEFWRCLSEANLSSGCFWKSFAEILVRVDSLQNLMTIQCRKRPKTKDEEEKQETHEVWTTLPMEFLLNKWDGGFVLMSSFSREITTTWL